MKKSEGTPASGSEWKWVKPVAPCWFPQSASAASSSLSFSCLCLCAKSSSLFVHTCTVFWNLILTALKDGISKKVKGGIKRPKNIPRNCLFVKRLIYSKSVFDIGEIFLDNILKTVWKIKTGKWFWRVKICFRRGEKLSFRLGKYLGGDPSFSISPLVHSN